MKSLLDHMNEPIENHPFDSPGPWLPEKPSRLCVLAALIAMNGGRLVVGGWGVMTGGGPYGKGGLSQDEALHLMRVASFIDGWLTATDSVDAKVLGAAIRAEHERVAALYETERKKL